MPRRRRIEPNPLALDWRDPEMPVIRTPKGVTKEFSANRVTNACAYMMEMADTPNWRDDPSYFWSKHDKGK